VQGTQTWLRAHHDINKVHVRGAGAAHRSLSQSQYCTVANELHCLIKRLLLANCTICCVVPDYLQLLIAIVFFIAANSLNN
jgi:hypothetical protein